MVSDLKNSRDFYERVMGLSPRNEGKGTCAYETGSCELKLQVDFDPTALKAFNLDPPRNGNRGDGSVYIVTIEGEIDQVYERIKEKGDTKIQISIVEKNKNYIFELKDKRKFDYETLKFLNKEQYIKKISI